MAGKIAQASAGLEAFSKTKDIHELEQAVETLEEVDLWGIAPERRLQARRSLLLNWSRALVALDAVKEPGFDLDKNVPSTRPPAVEGYPPGVDPQAIRDPQARAQYEAALAASRRNRTRYRTQALAIELDERAIESAHRVLDRWYTASAADQKELDAVFDEAGLSAARRAEVRNPPAPPAPQPSPPPAE